MKQANHCCLLQSHDLAFDNCCGQRHASGLAGQTSLAKEIACPEYGDDSFLPLFGKHDELPFAFVDIENRIRWIALRKHNLVRLISGYRSSSLYLSEQGERIEQADGRFGLVIHGLCSLWQNVADWIGLANICFRADASCNPRLTYGSFSRSGLTGYSAHGTSSEDQSLSVRLARLALTAGIERSAKRP